MIRHKNLLPRAGIALFVAVLSISCARSPEAREARFLERGKEHLKAGNFTSAALEFKNAAQVMPKDAEPLFQLALVYIEAKDRGTAIRILQKATELNPQHTQAQLKLAMLLAGSSNPALIKVAQERIQGVLAQAPNSPEALDTLAITELRTGNIDAAAADLERAVGQAPESVKSAIALAQVKFLQNDAGGAEAVLKKAAAANPKAVEPVVALAQLYINSGRKSEAEPLLLRAKQLNGNSSTILLFLAALQTDAGKTDQAEQTLQQLALLPDRRFAAAHAVFLFENGKRTEAVQELESIVKANPRDRAVRSLLVSVYHLQGRGSEAMKMLDGALKSNPKDGDALLQRGGLLTRMGRAKDAEKDLAALVALRPDSAAAHFEMGRAHQSNGSVSQARKEFQRSLELDPTFLPCRLALARDLTSVNDAAGATAVLDGAPAAQKSTLAYLSARNWVLLSTGKMAEARKGVERGLAISHTPDLLYQDASLKAQEKQYAEARKPLEELLSRYPASTPAVDLLAATYAETGNQAKALAVVRESAAAVPKSAAMRNLAGLWLLKAGDRTGARVEFRAAKGLDPTYLRPGLILANLDIEDGALQSARQLLDEAVAVRPQEVEAHYLRGVVETTAGNSDAAVGHYRKVLELEPRNLFALNNIANALCPRDLDQALKYAQSAHAIAPENAVVKDTMGWIYFRKGVFATAVKYLEEATARDASPKYQFHLGMACSKAGDRDRAKKILDAALRLDPKLAQTERDWLDN